MQENTGLTAPAADATPSRAAHPRRLVVLVPGLEGHYSRWKPLQNRLEQEAGFGPDEARWLPFNHRVRRWSLGSIDHLADKLHTLITMEWSSSGGYDEVVLVGHSMGGLIARQAYLLAAGAVSPEAEQEWGQRVVRIVLLASLNRGVDPARTIWMRPLIWLIRVIPFRPHFVLEDLLRGSNFLTTLRINWIRHFGDLTQAQHQGERWPDDRLKQPPLVVQILGSEDGLVSQDDSKDVLAFRGGHYIKVLDADHRKLYRLDLTKTPDQRYSALRRGFIEEFSDNRLGDEATVANDDPIKRVVFLLHGIRASNVDAWIKGLEQRIRERDPLSTDVRHPTYGYFTAIRFALPSVRQKNIRVFQDWYTEALAEHPNAEFSIIAHSNGTYLLGQSLSNTPGMRFAHVALAGSVLPTNFHWNRIKTENRQVLRVRNDRANRDWPVALLCSALRGLYMRDVGTGGFAGFEGQETLEVAYYPGDHGAALQPEYQNLLVNFVFGEAVEEPAALIPSPGYYRQLSNAMPYLAVLVICMVVLGVVLLAIQGGVVPILWFILGIIVMYVILDVI